MIYIIPVFRVDTTKIVSYALSVCEEPVLDSDIIAHFPGDATGKEIKNAAIEFEPTEPIWSNKIIEV